MEHLNRMFTWEILPNKKIHEFGENSSVLDYVLNDLKY